MAERPPVPDWDIATIPSTLELPPEAEKVSPEGFVWPSPPYATYPEAQSQTDPLGCEIVGLTGVRSIGRLTFFVPEQGVAYVQIPPARTTMPLRFSDFLSLTLTTPIAPVELSHGDPHAGMLADRRPSAYSVSLVGGGKLRGETAGHFEKDFGLFLFPTVDTKGGVLRMFVPRSAYTALAMGARIGEVLVEQKRATQQQVEKVVKEQAELRNRKIGDILLVRQVVSAQQLIEAIDQQSRMPLVRIGEALLSLGMVTKLELDEALAQQAVDRHVPLGELLVRMGVVTTEDLRVALARKMGYPLVNVDAFPIEAAALTKVSFAVASRLHVVPLLLRSGRLWWPSTTRRGAARRWTKWSSLRSARSYRCWCIPTRSKTCCRRPTKNSAPTRAATSTRIPSTLAKTMTAKVRTPTSWSRPWNARVRRTRGSTKACASNSPATRWCA